MTEPTFTSLQMKVIIGAVVTALVASIGYTMWPAHISTDYTRMSDSDLNRSILDEIAIVKSRLMNVELMQSTLIERSLNQSLTNARDSNRLDRLESK